MIALAVAALPALGDTLSVPPDGEILGQCVMGFSEPNWRHDEGTADIFSSGSPGTESHFFWKGAVFTGCKPVIDKTLELGPYQGVDDWVNAALLAGAEEARDYFRLVPAEGGLFVWLTAYGLASHENPFDTRVASHLVLFAKDWPKSGSCQAYYIEDNREGGVAYVFRTKSGYTVYAEEKGEKLTFRGRMISSLDLAESQPDLMVIFEGVAVWENKGFYR